MIGTCRHPTGYNFLGPLMNRAQFVTDYLKPPFRGFQGPYISVVKVMKTGFLRRVFNGLLTFRYQNRKATIYAFSIFSLTLSA